MRLLGVRLFPSIGGCRFLNGTDVSGWFEAIWVTEGRGDYGRRDVPVNCSAATSPWNCTIARWTIPT
jgi:hypothetical protein